MKFFLLLAALSAVANLSSALQSRLVCFYDVQNAFRSGSSQFSLADLELALQFCTHLVYGWAGINGETFRLTSLNEPLDVLNRHYATVTALKAKYPDVKFLLGVGGDRDLSDPDKYVNLIKAGRRAQSAFVDTARDFVRHYGFDGLDLALQLPRNKPRKVHSDVGSVWKSFKKFFTGEFVVDPEAAERKEQITDLVADLRSAFRPHDLLLTLTVLPNVNSSWYYDAPALINNLDFVTLAAFDFLTPERNPEEADFTAPLYEPSGQNRLPHYNVNFQVEHWLQQRVPGSKINVGIASHGRAWKMVSDSGSTGAPVVPSTAGAAAAGPLTMTPGLLNWAEVCAKLPSQTNVHLKGRDAPLRRVLDPSKTLGSYAFHAANDDDDDGVWVSYEDPDTAQSKAGYAKAKGLGGVALFDLSTDDFRGRCTGDKFPMLRAIKYRLL